MTSIVITGSTRGIGLGLATAFLSMECDVTISGRSQASTTAAIEHLSSNSPTNQLFAIPCDVRHPDQVQALWDSAHQHFGKIDIWINNAGFTSKSALPWFYTPDQVKYMVETNLLGAIYGSITAVQRYACSGRRRNLQYGRYG